MPIIFSYCVIDHNHDKHSEEMFHVSFLVLPLVFRNAIHSFVLCYHQSPLLHYLKIVNHLFCLYLAGRREGIKYTGSGEEVLGSGYALVMPVLD